VRFLSWAARCRRPLPLAAAALIAILVAGLAATPAAAHASLISSSPPDGAAVATAPTKVELIFSEDVGALSVIAVTGPDGVQVVDGPTQIRNASAVQPLKTLTAVGLYKIAYRVVSADGHPVSGRLTFTYAPPGSNVTEGHQGAPNPATGAADGHGAHLVALGILVLAAVAASVIALRKDRQYDRAATGTTPATVGEASPGAASTGAPDTAAPDNAAPDNAAPDNAAPDSAAADSATADSATGTGAKKQRAK
jgi:methionine-rich copper-binding protein CopC